MILVAGNKCAHAKGTHGAGRPNPAFKRKHVQCNLSEDSRTIPMKAATPSTACSRFQPWSCAPVPAVLALLLALSLLAHAQQPKKSPRQLRPRRPQLLPL